MSKIYYSILDCKRIKAENDLSPVPFFDYICTLTTYQHNPNNRDPPIKMETQRFQILKKDLPYLIEELRKIYNGS